MGSNDIPTEQYYGSGRSDLIMGHKGRPFGRCRQFHIAASAISVVGAATSVPMMVARGGGAPLPPPLPEPAGDGASRIREALRKDFPEIDALCSDAYLESVASVRGRSLDYAIHRKVRESLEWRRCYGVDDLRSAFLHVRGEGGGSETHPATNGGGVFVPAHAQEPSDPEGGVREPKEVNATTPTTSDDSPVSTNSEDGTIRESHFVPTPELVEVCASGAFVLREEEMIGDLRDPAVQRDEDGSFRRENCRRLVVHADTSRLNWWRTGVTAGLQYHVLVLEEALERIRTENQNRERNLRESVGEEAVGPLSESLVILVDTTNLPRLPPPLSAPRGMIQLMRKAYPDRIYRIYVGPVHPWLRKLYNYLSSSLRPRTREKIVLLDEAPSLARFGSVRTSLQ